MRDSDSRVPGPGGMAIRAAGFCLLFVASACAGRAPEPAPAPPPPAAIDTALVDSLRPRVAVRPLPLTNAFLAAVRAGTRTPDGSPGPAYWQNSVSYRISAELNPATARITGDETVTLHNGSPDTLRTVVVNLYQNVFASGAQRTRRVPITGGMRIERVAADGVVARPNAPAGHAGYVIDGTLMRVQLPFPLAPGRATAIDIAWSFIVPPRGAPRTGHDDHEVFVVAQWYPQIATYDDLRGWHDRPYWSNGEFYLEYADFEVDLTVPEGWIVGASGTLLNAGEVLDSAVIARLAAASASDAVVHVVTADDIDANTATTRAMGGQLTWHFRAEDVRDFAFAASNRYLWDAVRIELATRDSATTSRPVVSQAAEPVPAGAPSRPARSILAHALYRADAPHWERAAAFMAHAVDFHHTRWTPWPWSHITAAEGPIGGMEYPALIFIGAPEDSVDLYAVLSHEIAHQWWPMLAGSNETDHAWQDEGLATYTEDLSVADRFPTVDPFAATQSRYLEIAGSDAEVPIERPADLYGPGPQYGVATYRKPGTLLRALGAVIGTDTLHAALREYTRRWSRRHPATFDFFNTIEDVAGRDLDWFWTPWWYDTATLDQAVTAVDIVDLVTGGERVSVTIADQGSAPMPVPITITLNDGTTIDIDLPVEPWLEGRTRQRFSRDIQGRVTRIEIDAARMLPDADRSDNVWVRPSR